jgi:hypothetical protein
MDSLFGPDELRQPAGLVVAEQAMIKADTWLNECVTVIRAHGDIVDANPAKALVDVWVDVCHRLRTHVDENPNDENFTAEILLARALIRLAKS